METQIICLRHAEAESTNRDSPKDIDAGDVPPDPPLTHRGVEQANAVANSLAETDALSVFVSEALRSRQTGEIIASHLGVPLEVVPELAETSMGDADHLPGYLGLRAELLRQWLIEDRLSERLPSGETGHSVVTRMTKALDDIVERCGGNTAIVVGHVASLTVAVSALCDNGSSLWNKPLPNAVPFALTLSDNRWRVQWPVRSEQDSLRG